jgi:hypothetical protein
MTDEKKPVTLYTTEATPITAVSSASSMISTGVVIEVPRWVRPPDDHPIFHLIGRVAASWSALEHVLDRIIWTLLGVISAKGACVTSQLMGSTPRYRTIIAQLTLRKSMEPQFEKYITRVHSLMNATYEPQDKRNMIIHDSWYLDSTRDQPGQFKSWPAKDLRFGINSIDLADIESTLEAIRALSDRAEALFSEINADVAASKRKQP